MAPPPPSTPTAAARLTCLCGAISEPGTLLLAPSIPLISSMCHCNSCRHVTGSLNASFPRLKSSPSEATLSKVTAYKSSPAFTRYFCSTCGCHCFCIGHEQEEWYCLGGIIEKNPFYKAPHSPFPSFKWKPNYWLKDVVKVSYHEYVADTIDGGLTPCFLKLRDRDIPTCSAAASSPSSSTDPSSQQKDNSLSDLSQAAVFSMARTSNSEHKLEADAYLPAKCHCSGTTLWIKRASFPLSSSSSSSTGLPTRDLPTNPHKYPTYLCACRSCRLVSGTSLTPWTLIPPGQIFNPTPTTTSPAPLLPLAYGDMVLNDDAQEKNPGLTLKHYWSSPGNVCRSFCATCGATVMYWNRKRPGEVDIATGILREEDGRNGGGNRSLARDWLEWQWGRCSFLEECVDEEVGRAWSGCKEMMGTLKG